MYISDTVYVNAVLNAAFIFVPLLKIGLEGGKVEHFTLIDWAITWGIIKFAVSYFAFATDRPNIYSTLPLPLFTIPYLEILDLLMSFGISLI